jgi:hypothetical protein
MENVRAQLQKVGINPDSPVLPPDLHPEILKILATKGDSAMNNKVWLDKNASDLILKDGEWQYTPLMLKDAAHFCDLCQGSGIVKDASIKCPVCKGSRGISKFPRPRH